MTSTKAGNRNAMRIRIDAGNKDETVTADKTIADAFGNRFYTQLDFQLLEGHMPFYQSTLGDRLEYELTFNDYSHVILATGDADSSYDIENISLEYEIVTTWSRKWTVRLNEELRRQGHAVKTFRDVDAAMQEYAQVTGHNLDPSPTFITRVTTRKTRKDREILAWWPTDSPSNPCFIGCLIFFDVWNMLAMLADELYLAMLQVGHAATAIRFLVL